MRINKINYFQTNYTPTKQQTLGANTAKQLPQTTNFSKFSSENLKANYLTNFKGNISAEISSESNIGTLNQETHFFREPKTDEIVQGYVLDKFSNKPKINIVSGACSMGDEAKSYAMMLDSVGKRLHISGFDISTNVLEQANDSSAHLLIDTNVALIDCHESFITDDDCGDLTPYQQKCREKFNTYYDKVGETYKKPVHPEAQKNLEELDSMLQDEEKYKEAEAEYNEVISKINDFSDLFTTGFKEAIEASRNILLNQTKDFYVFQDFKAKEGSFDNCDFKQGDVMNLEKLYAPNSVDVLLYRNALYHTLCQGDGGMGMLRFMGDDAPEKMDTIAKQMNKVVGKQGLVVFGENESMQGIDSEVVETAMRNNGFKQFVHNGEKMENIWVKTKEID